MSKINYKEQNKLAYNLLSKEYEDRIYKDYSKDKILLKSFFDLLEDLNCNDLKTLDIGCGNGLNLKMFDERGYKTYGIDISNKMTELAIKTSPNSIVYNEDFLSYEFNALKFQGIIAKASIHNFSKQDAKTALAKINYLLTNNGYFFIATTVSQISNEGFFEKVDYKSDVKRYRKFWTYSELKEELENSNFQIVKEFNNNEIEWNKNWMNFICKKT